jgi:(1->4)-alpha-D-glucan 1-alpha-D-glucosylmutase
MLEHWEDARIKLHVLVRGLQLRQSRRKLFELGDYTPIEAVGDNADHIVAAARSLEGGWVLGIVPRLVYTLLSHQAGVASETVLPLAAVWQGTQLSIPDSCPAGAFLNVLTNEQVQVERAAGQAVIPVSQALQTCPVALLVTAP